MIELFSVGGIHALTIDYEADIETGVERPAQVLFDELTPR
jgi:hypothetical protein